MKTIKKLTVLVLAFLMIFAMSGCSGLKIIKEVANVDGRIIAEGEFRYYLENVKTQMLTEAGLSTEEEIESFWAGDINGENAADVAKNKAMEEVIRVEIANILAQEEQIAVSSETKSSYKEAIKTGNEQIDQLKETTGLDDDSLLDLILKEETARLYANYLSSVKSEDFTPAAEDVIAKYKDEYVRVKHIFLLRTQQQEEISEEIASENTIESAITPEDYEASQKLLAAEVLDRAKSGENFEALIEEYNEDPGATENGYTFTKNSGMVQVFEDASFALKTGEVSEIIEQPQGWHIIKRYALLEEGEEYTQYINEVRAEIMTGIFNSYIDSLKVNYTIEIDQGAVKGIKIK